MEVKFRKVTPKRVSFPSRFPFFPPFSNSFALRPGSNHCIQSNNSEIKTLRETPFFWPQYWGKEPLPAGENRGNPGKERERKKDSLILSINQQVLSLLWGYTGMGKTHTNTAKALRIELRFSTTTHKRQDQRCQLNLNVLRVC